MPRQNLEYVWIDGYGLTRSKIRCCDMPAVTTALPPEWNYDGSSTGQATTDCSEVILKPVRTYPSPFPAADVLVLCDTYQVLSNHVTLYRNTRVALSQALKGESQALKGESQALKGESQALKGESQALKGESQPLKGESQALKGESNPCEARYGFEQEFFLTDAAGQVLKPFSGKGQKDYYCGVGGDKAIGRAAVEQAFLNCIKAGLNITGMNAEVAPAQWELQIDDYGLAACDGLWMLRFILTKTVEQFGYGITLHPKPLLKDSAEWNGSGCHANFSTQRMRRSVGGYDTILETIQALKDRHADDIKHYGEHNELRLSGSCETSTITNFTYGVGDRSASVRIPTATWLAKCGYLEDRRPASNMDPYRVALVLLEASLK